MKIAVKNRETPRINLSSTTRLILAFKNCNLRPELSFIRGIVFILQNEYYYVACLPIYGNKNNRLFVIIAEKDNRIVFKQEMLILSQNRRLSSNKCCRK